MKMPSSVTSVSQVSGKLGLAPVSHTLNTGDFGAEGSASIFPATLHREAGAFLDAIVMRWTLCPKMS